MSKGHGIIAQLGEHLPYKQGVTGSSPVGPISRKRISYGGIAQLARAHGSYPWCRWFKSDFRYLITRRICSLGFFASLEEIAFPMTQQCSARIHYCVYQVTKLMQAFAKSTCTCDGALRNFRMMFIEFILQTDR